jgi:hypothetical protein
MGGVFLKLIYLSQGPEVVPGGLVNGHLHKPKGGVCMIVRLSPKSFLHNKHAPQSKRAQRKKKKV